MQHLPKTAAALRQLVHPRAPGYETWARQFLEASKPAFSDLYEGPDDLDFLTWVASYGRLQNEELIGPFYPPVPSAELQDTGCFGKSSEQFLSSGIHHARMLLTVQEVFGQTHLGDGGTVYDLGSGAGRALRWFQRIEGVNCIGSDVLERAVSWCDSHLDGRYFVNEQRPPLPLEDDSCDLVYALSIFSHFGEEAAELWMAELARVCRPDGLIVVTTHGAFTLGVLLESEEHRTHFHVAGDRAVSILRGFERDGFHFEPYPDQVYEQWPEVERTQWGQSFLGERHVREAWGDHVELVGSIPAGLGLIQDVHCLRPR